MLIAPEKPDCETIRVPVLKVFDGDGFLTRIDDPRSKQARELSVGFGFIDAPEMDQRGGPEARDVLDGLIRGQWLDLAILMKMDTGGIVDRHGRIVAVPYLRQHLATEANASQSFLRRLFVGLPGSAVISRNIELEMVLNGWAWVLDRYEPDEHYFDALNDARKHRRGIWAWDDNVHPWEFEKQRYRSNRRVASQPGPVRLINPCSRDDCDRHLVERSGRYGKFYGCSNFPRCRHSTSNCP